MLNRYHSHQWKIQYETVNHKLPYRSGIIGANSKYYTGQGDRRSQAPYLCMRNQLQQQLCCPWQGLPRLSIDGNKRRHHIGHQESDHGHADHNEEDRIRNRLCHFLTKPDHQFQIGNISLQHLRKIARLLTCLDGRHVEIGEIRGMFCQCLRGRGTTSDIFLYFSQHLSKSWMPRTIDQQVPDSQDRQPGLDKRQQLLIKDHELPERKPTERPRSWGWY